MMHYEPYDGKLDAGRKRGGQLLLTEQSIKSKCDQQLTRHI